MRLRRMGMPYDMRIPMVAIEVTALKAMVEPRDGRVRQKERMALSHMALSGQRYTSFTPLKYFGYNIKISSCDKKW
jgi:hypothetical protein